MASTKRKQQKEFLQSTQQALQQALGRGLQDDGRLEQLLRHEGEVRHAILSALRDYSSANRSYKDEEVPSDLGYPPGYAAKPLAAQIEELARRFPRLRTRQAREFAATMVPRATVPGWTEGWFAIPRWDAIASTYHEAIEAVLRKIAFPGVSTEHVTGMLGPNHLQQTRRKTEMLAQAARDQPGDLLLLPAQFGKRHAGRSCRRARALFDRDEFGLGAFEVGALLMTHPQRLAWERTLRPDCAGDDYELFLHGARFHASPSFDLAGLHFWPYHRNDDVGAVTAAVPSLPRA